MTLYGVGVGPGAPDLMTVRAVNVLRSVDVIAIPRRSQWDESVAWRIAGPAVGDVEGQERLFLEFPMTRDPLRLKPAWDFAFEAIRSRLQAGRSVAFITEGDPFVYSTFIYLHKEASTWGVPIEVVPGVTSITAVPAALGVPLADGGQRVAIVPASYDVSSIEGVVDAFDTTVLMKVSSVMPAVVSALESLDLLGNAAYVSKAHMPQQRIVHDVASIRNDRCDYFSMVLVSKPERSGSLVSS